MTAFLTILAAFAGPLLIAYCVWQAISSARTPQGASAWVVFLIMAPWFAVPSYFLFGHSKLKSYAAMRRDSRTIIERIDAFGRAHPPTLDIEDRHRVFEKLARMPVVGGNGADLLIDGQATFDAIYQGLDAAQSYICVQFYTIRNDTLGRAFADRLIAAARRGVTVRMIFDGVGSYSLSRNYVSALRSAGVIIFSPKNSRGPTSRFQLNFRNHRKTVIIDGTLAFLGGLNVADDYMGRNPAFGNWRDTGLALRGPVATQLQLVFVEDWHWSTGETLGDGLDWRAHDDPADLAGLVLASGPSDALDTGSLFFSTAIAQAQDRIWLASPYFVPDAEVLSALTSAALRGCDVRLILPDTIDHYLPWLAAFAYFDELRAVGVKIYRYQDGFMHQKVALIDSGFAAIGTANLDNRSFRLNYETMVCIWHEEFARKVEAMLQADLENCTLLDRDLAGQKPGVRIGAPLARLLSPIL